MSHSLVLPSALYATDEEIDSTSQKKEKKDKKDKKEKKEKKDKKEARVLLSDEEADDGAFRKRKAVLNEPVLPAPKFATLATEHNDEEKTQHQGRTRKFEHVEGNWAVHVYIPLHFETDAATLLTITNVLEEWKRFQSSSSSESSSCHDHPALQLSFEQSPLESLHVSLSHTAPIRDFEIEPFLSALAAELAQLGTSVSSTSTSSCTSVALQHVTSFVIPTALSMPPIDITLSGVEFYRNDDSTRVFAALQVHDQNRSTSSPTSITVDSSSTHDALYDAPIAVAQNVDAKERVTQESIRDKESLFSTDPQCFNPLRDLSRAVDGTPTMSSCLCHHSDMLCSFTSIASSCVRLLNTFRTCHSLILIYHHHYHHCFPNCSHSRYLSKVPSTYLLFPSSTPRQLRLGPAGETLSRAPLRRERTK